jgi:hypothetical protein
MPDSNLNSSINSIKSNLLTDIPTATVTELLSIAKSLKGLNLWNDSAIETAVNDRAITLLSGATSEEIIKISSAIKSMRGPDISSDVEITSLNTVTTDLIPDTDVTHDLGSSTNRFNDLYLDGNTIHLGNQTISKTATGLSISELKIGSGTNTVSLTPSSDGVLQMTGTDSSGNAVAQIENVPSITSVTNFNDLLSIANPAAGTQMMVTSTNRLFIYTGTGWYKIADMANESPTAITGINSTYDLASDGTSTTITAVSSDPEGFPLTWSYAITAGALNGTTVSNVDNVFTITPSTVNETTFTVTFSVTDGVGTATFSSDFTLSLYASAGGRLFTSSTTWTAPADVTLVHAVCVGAGAEAGTVAGGGGGLGWKNDIVVVPGQSYTVVVGQGGQNKSNQHSYFISSGTVAGYGGSGSSGGSYVGDGGGNGGDGKGSGTYQDCGGGGAGGYTGDGGDGKAGSTGQAGNGQGGGAGGSMANSGGYSCGGGGVGVYGQGANGVGGLAAIHPQYHPSPTSAGTGGSGGGNALSTYGHADAADYGGGGGGGGSGAGGGDSGGGAVRIIWGGGSGVRAFPSTNTSLAYSNTGTGE